MRINNNRNNFLKYSQCTLSQEPGLIFLDTFEVVIFSNGNEDMDEAAKLLIAQDWILTTKDEGYALKKEKKQEKSGVKLLESAQFAEFEIGLYILS